MAGGKRKRVAAETAAPATGKPKGLAADLGLELGKRLGVPVEMIPYPTPGAVADAAKTAVWDVGFIGAEPQRANEIDFTAAYVEIEATYLVPPGSPIKAIADVDRKGVRIAISDRSAYDLYKVPVFTLEQVRVIQAAGDPDDAAGDWTPQNVTGAAVDNVRHDYEENFLLANRISNLVTTRSDHFTCYVLVQGWRGAGTTNPELVVQRRLAFTADRSGVTPTSKEVPLQYFYNE